MLYLSSMSKLRQELEELRARCEEFSSIASTRTLEVQHLKQANQQQQQDIEHLRGAVSLGEGLGRGWGQSMKYVVLHWSVFLCKIKTASSGQAHLTAHVVVYQESLRLLMTSISYNNNPSDYFP